MRPAPIHVAPIHIAPVAGRRYRRPVPTSSPSSPRALPRALPRSLAALLAALATACGAPPPVAPPPPPLDLADALPIDAPLTGVVRPSAVEGPLRTHVPIAADHPALQPLTPDRLAALGFDPDRPLWIAVRGGPLLAVRRAADDAERVLAAPDALPASAVPAFALDPAFAPDPGPADPTAPALAQWFDGNPLPPAWLHLRLVGPRPPVDPAAPDPDPTRALSAAHGALQTAALDGPPETLAAALGVDPAALAALDLDAPGLAVHRLLDAPHPTLVVTRHAPDRLVVDYIWDWELGPHALLDALATLPERRTPDPAVVSLPPDHRIMHPPAPDEIARLRLDHARATDTAHLLGEVAALQGVLGQGRLPVPPLDALRADRRHAERPRRLMAPAADAFVATGLVVSLDPAGAALGDRAGDPAPARSGPNGEDPASPRPPVDPLRVRLTLDYAPRAHRLATLRDGRPPIDHAAAVAPTRGEAAPFLATLALAPATAAATLTAHLHAPDRDLGAHLADTVDCGLPCLPALWTTPIAYARDPAALAAQLTGHAALAPALADATGAAFALAPLGPRPVGVAAAAVSYPPPATVPRALWSSLEPAARWLVGDTATVVLGPPAHAAALEAATRTTPTTDATALRFTALPPYTAHRVDGTLTFERAALALDLVIHPPDAPPPP